MSFDYNYKFWVATQKDLEDVFKRQEVFKKLKPIQDKTVTHYLFAELYARYVQIVNKLGYIYHHTFQVQKRDVIKELVRASSQRLLELKNELKKLELSEFIYIDKTLIQRKLTPDDITVWTPKYFPYWRPSKIQEMIDGSINRVGDTRTIVDSSNREVKTGVSGSYSKAISISLTKPENAKIMHNTVNEVQNRNILTDVVTLIQSHERARKGRVYLMNIWYNPDVYKPRMREDGTNVQYKFTYKPTQAMLIPVRRTRFEANYLIQRRDLKDFNYYVKPVHKTRSQFLDDDELDMLEEESKGEQIAEEEFDFDIEEDSFEGSEGSVCYEGVTETDSYEFTQMNESYIAARKIQSFWRGYRDRKIYKALMERKYLIYGMAQEFRSKSKKTDMYKSRLDEEFQHRMLKKKYDDEFLQFCVDEKARILRVKGPWIMEDISDHIRAWFKEFYDKLSCFHPYPDEVKGGTLLLLRGETMDIFEYDEKLKAAKLTKEEKAKRKEKEKEKKKKEKEKLKKLKRAITKRKAKLKAAGFFDMNDEIEISKSIRAIETTINKYKKEWEEIDETLNTTHAIYKEWITSDYYAEMHEELRLTVDELMSLEYELLQRALAKDKKKKYRAPKKKNKGKSKKGKKRNIPKDITADRTIESLFSELKDAGIIKTNPRKTLDAFIGERNHCAYDILNIKMKDTPPFKGEIKDVLSEYVLGMGPLNISKPKAICLVGPTSCGKKLLCDILATEIDAVIFDISPENTIKYESNLKYLTHIIVKMAKIVQPTILYIKDVHRVFWKKIPNEYINIAPRLLQSQLKKNILKPLKTEDKVFLLGTTDAPWTANAKMKKIFQKILLVPKTDYSTSFILRRNVTLQTYGIQRDFNFSALALVTRDYTTGDLVKNIEETLNVRRRMDLVNRSLHPMEFLDNFLAKDDLHFPPELKEWDKFLKWYKKASKMAKSRAKLMKLRELQMSNEIKKK